MDIDFRKEVEILEKEYATYVLHIQSSKYIKCKCFNDLYKSGNPKCNLCFGSGRLTKISVKKAISYNMEGTSIASEMGNVVKDRNVFIFNYKSNLKEKDIILLVGFSNNKILDIKKVFEVDYTNNVRGDRGRIEYNVVYTKNTDYIINKYKKIPNILGANNNINKLTNGVLIGDVNGV